MVCSSSSLLLPLLKINKSFIGDVCPASNHPLALYPGVKVCQFIFSRMVGEAEYTGKFQDQEL